MSKNCISEISRTPEINADRNANPPCPAEPATEINNATSQITNIKFYVPAVTLPINDNINFLENIKLGFRRTNSWNKYRSEKTATQKSII